MQCAGHNGFARHREPFEPYHHHPHQPLHVVLSARLPIFVKLLTGTFFFASHAALVMMSMYLVGILCRSSHGTPAAALSVPQRRDTLRNGVASLPHAHHEHHCATPGQKVRSTSRKWAASYLFASIVVWALNYFPLDREEPFTPEEYALPPASTTPLLSTPSATPTSR